MRILYKLFWALTWVTEAVGGIFYPLLLILASLMASTNESRRLIEIPGFPLVLAALGIAMIAMLTGLILYVRRKRKAGWILLIVGALFFAAALIGIRICCMPASGATSLKITGEYRLTGFKLIARHGLPLLVPLFVLLAALCRRKSEDTQMYEEALADVAKNVSTLSLKNGK
ncbi:MAG: hypothetical protein IKI63_01965 [Clostridia bacterium]|nr:hypothetical protein [Clostridia bacterium]